MKLELPIAINFSPRGKQTLLICRIDLKKLQDFEKKFQWKNPGNCPECKGPRLWGHGFVLRNFVGYTVGLWMKRFRCPDCHAVHTCRPEPFLPGVQYPQDIQKTSLEAKLAGKPFLKNISRQTQQHWWKAFRFRCKEMGNWNDPLEFYRQCRTHGQLPVTKRRIYLASRPEAEAPYLTFAATVKPLLIYLE